MLVFYYNFKVGKGKFTAKLHSWKRLRFEDMKEIMTPEIGPKKFRTQVFRG